MIKTYQDILDTMQSAYFEKTGNTIDWHSDNGIRMQTVASEVLSLYAFGDFVLKEAMVQTAEGDYLDNHAALRAIRRKTASKAYGTLTFFVPEAQENAVTIPSGTVCAMKSKPFVQLITTQEGVIAAGDTAVTVPAEATRAGADGNAPTGTVTVMVNPPAEVLGVRNDTAFQGGYDTESDEALRRRILQSYQICQTGFSADSIREQLLQIEELADCSVQFSNDEYLIDIKPKSGQLTEALETEINRRMAVSAVTDCAVVIRCCTIKMFRLVLNLYRNYTDAEAEEEIRTRVSAICSALHIGESLNLSRITYALADLPSVRFCEAASTAATEGVVLCDSGAALSLEELEVHFYE